MKFFYMFLIVAITVLIPIDMHIKEADANITVVELPKQTPVKELVYQDNYLTELSLELKVHYLQDYLVVLVARLKK